MNDDGLFVFVLMPFDTIFDDIYKLGIKESATNLGLRAERVDEQKYSEGVLDRIYRQIDLADIIIDDMTGQNPNVFYEVGYAHAKEKLCILLTSSANDIPFDLKHRRHIVYEQSISKLKAQLSEDLIWARNIIKDTQKSHIQVNIKKPSGVVEKDRWTATGRVDFKIVLSNESTKPATGRTGRCALGVKPLAAGSRLLQQPRRALRGQRLAGVAGARRLHAQGWAPAVGRRSSQPAGRGRRAAARWWSLCT